MNSKGVESLVVGLIITTSPAGVAPRPQVVVGAPAGWGRSWATASTFTHADRATSSSGQMGAPVMEERRRFVRIRPTGHVPKTATIIIGANGPIIRCTLVDISAGGACLETASAERLPPRFGLLHGRVRKRCLVVWRNQQRLGVQF
jgi:hypothetical protein